MCVLDRDEEFKPWTSQVPKVMQCATDFILKHGLHTAHIFRKEGSKARVKKVKVRFICCWLMVALREFHVMHNYTL